MRMPLLPILLLLVFNGLVDWYIVRAVFTRCRRGAAFWRPFALWTSVALAAALLVMLAVPKKEISDNGLTAMMTALYAYLSVYAGKLVFTLVDLLSKIPALFRHKRLKWLGRAGIVLGVLTTGVMAWGALFNRYSTQLKGIEIVRSDIPEAFDGLTIVQLSDIHTGSYMGNPSHLRRMVREVNALHPDVILFTGDIVNRHSTELTPYTEVLAGLDAPLGVYSVTGNHDYGDYHDWPSPADKAADVANLWNMQRRMGWTMLNDSTATLRAGTDSLMIIGVQNISEPPFVTYGDLDKAYPGDPADPSFKILMSHNPMHWNNDIKDAPDKNIALTLSGHTHAMQMELAGKSPAAFVYPTWGGLYADADSAHLLYVNIGMGTVGIPARIGATPEITLITLRRK